VGSRVNARFEHLFLAFENYCVKSKYRYTNTTAAFM